MSIFNFLSKSKPKRSGIVFIVEDNEAYAYTLRSFLQVQFPELKEIKIFPDGEACLPELIKKPDVIIIDYFLDSKNPNAETGLEIIRQIRETDTNLHIIVLSSQEEFVVIVESVRKYNCSYVKKDEEAFEKVAQLIEAKRK